MKKFRLPTILILSIGVIILYVRPVLAFPPLPSSFYGTVKVGAANVADGTVISAKIKGVQYAATTTFTYLVDSVYNFDIPGDDSSTPGTIEGGVENDCVLFFIGSTQATQARTWHSGTNVTLNLSASGVPAPGAFCKSNPSNAASSVATNPTLSWAASSGATSYKYCYASTSGCTPVTSTTSTTAVLSGLLNNQIYYWQVQAINADGTADADTGTYWSFTTVVSAPGAFSKISPTSGAIGVATNPTLSWGTSSGATSYEYCYATTTGCTSWSTTGTNTSVALSGLSVNRIYYWQVGAVNAGGITVANAGTYWSFTTIQPSFRLFLPIILR